MIGSLKARAEKIEFDTAISEFEHGLKKGPSTAIKARLYLGLAYATNGKWNTPENFSSFIEERLKQFEAASQIEAYLTRIIELDGSSLTDYHAYLAFAELYRKKMILIERRYQFESEQ